MMTKEQLIHELQKREMDHLLGLIKDAQSGKLEEIELVKSIGLIYDSTLNDSLIHVLIELGVTMIYISEEDQ